MRIDSTQVPDGWRVARLAEVLKLEYGVSLPERSRRPGCTPVVGSAGVVGFHDRATHKGPGVVVGRKGSIGSVTWMPDDFVPIDTTYCSIPANGHVDIRWMYHLLNNENLASLNSATGVPGLNRGDVHSLRRLIPPLSEQRAIAAVLDSIDEAIERADEVIAATERLRDALLHELLTRGLPGQHSEWKEVPGFGTIPATWKAVRLGDVAEVIGGSTPSRTQPKFWGGEIPWVIPSEMTELIDRELRSSRESITNEGLRAAGLRVLPAGSVLLTTRATIGATAIAALPVTTNQGFQSLVGKKGIDSLWLYYCVSSKSRELIRRSAGSTFREVSRDAVRKLPVLLPPLPEQRAIAAVLDSVDVNIERAREAQAILSAAATSIADALLAGRVRVDQRKR